MTNFTEPSSPRKKLENHLRNLLDDERFFDIALKCSDNVTLYACKNVLAVRSHKFNEQIFDESKKSTDQSDQHQLQQLEFNNINSIAMKFILEYLYTSNNERELLRINDYDNNDNNVIEIYYSAIYFDLGDLQEDIIEFTKKALRDKDKDLGKKLLTDFIEKFSLDVSDNEMGSLLVDWVAKIQLHPDEEDSLSLSGLQYLLEKTHNTEIPFATYEINLLEYTLVKTKQIILEEKIGPGVDPYDMNYDSSTFEQIKERLIPLLPSIDLNIIDSEDIVQKIEPLNIFPSNMITNAYRYRVEMKHKSIQPIRGSLIFKWKRTDNQSSLDVNDNGFSVKADPNLKTYKSIAGDLTIKGKGVHKWNILIEKLDKRNSDVVYVGICGFDEKFDKPGDKEYQGWALGSDGYIYNKKDWKWNNSTFKENDIVNIYVDMSIKHCYFGVNNVINYVNYGHSFPDEIYPFVSLRKGTELRVLPSNVKAS